MEELIKKMLISVHANTGTRIKNIEVSWTGFVQTDPEIALVPQISAITLETCKEYKNK